MCDYPVSLCLDNKELPPNGEEVIKNKYKFDIIILRN